MHRQIDTKTFKTSGKNGKIYVVNADNLGGYKLGPGQHDNVLQTIETDLAVFGGAGCTLYYSPYFHRALADFL